MLGPDWTLASIASLIAASIAESVRYVFGQQMRRWTKMADTNGLKLIGHAFAVVTFAVTVTAALATNVEAERIDVQTRVTS